jgi:hypothetical protein
MDTCSLAALRASQRADKSMRHSRIPCRGAVALLAQLR